MWSPRSTSPEWATLILWSTAGSGIETDGAGFHMDRTSFEEDRRRWNVTTRLGIPTLVVSYALLLNRPDEFIAMVRDALNSLSAAA